jgi:Fe2+ or Zn2+ uptake regulation protein
MENEKTTKEKILQIITDGRKEFKMCDFSFIFAELKKQGIEMSNVSVYKHLNELTEEKKVRFSFYRKKTAKTKPTKIFFINDTESFIKKN